LTINDEEHTTLLSW